MTNRGGLVSREELEEIKSCRVGPWFYQKSNLVYRMVALKHILQKGQSKDPTASEQINPYLPRRRRNTTTPGSIAAAAAVEYNDVLRRGNIIEGGRLLSSSDRQ